MAIPNIDQLIQDWRQGKQRGLSKSTFATNRKGYQQFVARVAGEYLPRIREFITEEHVSRKTVLKAWKQLVAGLEEDMRMLDAFDPSDNTQFFAAIVIAKGALRDKAARKAFEQSKIEPVDTFGNPEFISGMAATLDTIIDQTYHALRGITRREYHRSLVRRASQRLHNALTKGTVKDFVEVQSLLLPSLTVVEMELEKYLIKKSKLSDRVG